jgi:hypothetical protein
MLVERVIWTTLPAGVDGDGHLHISVHVAPRLTTDNNDPAMHTLKEFPAFASWPKRLATLSFKVQIGGITADAKPVSVVDPALWDRIFAGTTAVKPHAFQDHAKRNFHVFGVRDVLRFVTNTYADLAASGPELPSIDDDAGPLAAFAPLGDITTWIRDSKSFYDELARARTKAKGTAERETLDGKVVVEHVAEANLSAAEQQAQDAFFQAYRFYYRPGSQRPDLPAGYKEPPPKIHDFDFHEIVSLLADHPVLLRSLGLVVDLVIDLNDPANLPKAGTIKLLPSGDLPESPPRCPATNYEQDGKWFGARPKQSNFMQRGLLNLTPEFWDLFQVDVDGAALQAVGFGDTLGRMRDVSMRNQDTPDKTGAPALRSGGLALARDRRGDALLIDLKDRADKNAKIESGVAVTFDAEDLVRGYRVDVFDRDAPGGPRWFTLHDRVTQHSAGDPAGAEALMILPPVHDEGYLKSTAASSERQDHPNPSDDLYLHETVVAWEGWSLAAHRPGKAIVEPGEGDGGGSMARIDPARGQKAPLLSVVSVAPSSLPRLRVGHHYKLRVRTVDLAGNSRTFTEKQLDLVKPYFESEEQAYQRLEPVPSPTVLRRHLDTEGESLEHLVIRSNWGISAANYASADDVMNALAGKPYAYAEASQRHIAPPKGSALMAEQDSRFESAFAGTPAQVNSALWLALREEGTFLDPKIVDPASGKKTIDQSQIQVSPPGAALPTGRGAGLSEGADPDAKKKLAGAYAYYPDGQVVLPYLPDPFAMGISLTGYDYWGNELFHEVVPFSNAWPVLTPFRIRLSEGPEGAPPSAAFEAGVLEMRLAKADVVRAKLASVFSDGRLEDFAIWQWMSKMAPAPQPMQVDELAKAARAGRHWVFTPHRWLTFTHAVQQPFAIPDMTKVAPKRPLGATYSEFAGTIDNHAKSTGRIDVFATWSEDVDLVTAAEPNMGELGTAVPHTAHAFGFDIMPDESPALVTRPDLGRISRQEFGDTKYRNITYHSVATTRFREFLPAKIANDPTKIQQIELTVGLDGKPKSPLVLDVPSSARPAHPDLIYTMPTFRWQREDAGPIRTHVRQGNGIRVWLRRPWFSSGDGEQLGVVLEPGIRLPPGWSRSVSVIERSLTELAMRPPFVSVERLARATPGPARGPRRSASSPRSFAAERLAEPPGGLLGRAGHIPLPAVLLQPTSAELHRMLKPYVTKWGTDPVWESRPPEQPPTVAAFPDHVSYASGLTLEEVSPYARVVVAGHEVHWDKARGLWYSDITIDAGGSYYPFVRLALARFQPHSVEGAHLSRVSVADFMQLVPDRTAQVELGPGSAQITVSGFSGGNILGPLSPSGRPPAEEIVPRPNTIMRVALQRRLPAVPGDLGWEGLSEVALTDHSDTFQVTWTGSTSLPEGALDAHQHRLLITEIETFPRDQTRGDPQLVTSPIDFVRERVVYADAFEL